MGSRDTNPLILNLTKKVHCIKGNYSNKKAIIFIHYRLNEIIFCFLYFVDHASLYNLVNKTNLVHNFSSYIYIYQSTVWCAGWPPCTPDSHPHRITSNECRMNTVVSPDDGPVVARNM
jgi:hypothetical protein